MMRGMRMMSYGWFVKLRTFISTSTKCTCVPTHGTEVSVSVGWLFIGGSLAFRPGSGGEGVGGLGIPWSLDSLRNWGWTGLAQWAFWPRPRGRPCGRPWWAPAWQSGTLWPPAWLHGRSWAWASWSTRWTTAEREREKRKKMNESSCQDQGVWLHIMMPG